MSDPGNISPEPIGPHSGKKRSPIKYVAIGCGVILLLVVIGLVVIATQWKNIAKFGLRKLTEEPIAALPPEVDKEEARRVVDTLLQKMTSGDIQDPQEFQQQMNGLTRLITESKQNDGIIDQSEALEIYDVLKEIAGVAPEPSPEPSAEPAAEPPQEPPGY